MADRGVSAGGAGSAGGGAGTGARAGAGAGAGAGAAAEQLRFLVADLRRSVNGRWWRWLSVPLAPGALSVVGYRLSRAAHLALGRPYAVLHTLLAPCGWSPVRWEPGSRSTTRPTSAPASWCSTPTWAW